MADHKIPAGWHPDPGGSGQLRWWDGAGWTERMAPAPSAAAAPPPLVDAGPLPGSDSVAGGSVHVPQGSSVPAGTWTADGSVPAGSVPQGISAPYGSASGHSSHATGVLGSPAGYPGSTLWIWLFVLTPLVALITLPLIDEHLIWQLVEAGIAARGPLQQFWNPMLSVVQFIGVAVYAAGVLFAFFDHRELMRRGFQRPFHWAWAFAPTILVYAIGRSIVVRRQTGSGMAPMWVAIAITILMFIVSMVFLINILIPLVQLLLYSYRY